MKQSMFETLLGLPLFQGLGYGDLTRILESTRLDFETAAAGSVLIQQDQLCEGLTFVLEGDIILTTRSADRTWSVEETIATPFVCGLEVLYGSLRHYRHTLMTRSETRLLQMDKRTVGALIAYFEVFRLNVMNLLTTTVVRHDMLHWLPAEQSLKGRIRGFMRAHVLRPAGEKHFRISQQKMGEYLGEDKRFVARALHEMEHDGLLQLERQDIFIPSFEALLSASF